MTVAGSILLIMVGAILAYAVNVDISGIDLQAVGVIMIVAGLAGLLIGLIRIFSARRRVTGYSQPTEEVPPHRHVRDDHQHGRPA